MSETARYYRFAEEAAETGEVAYLKHCVDEILRLSAQEGTRPEFWRIFKILYDARVHFLQNIGDVPPQASLTHGISEDSLQRMRDLDALSSALDAITEGRPIGEVIERIRSVSVHPIRPKK